MKRPMAVIGITYFVSQIVAVAVGTAMSTVFCLTAIALAALSFIMLSDKHRRVVLPVLVSCAIAFGAYSVYCFVRVEPAQRLYGQTIYIRGEITEEPYSANDRYYYIIDTSYIESTESLQNTRIRISTQTPLEAEITDIFESTIKVNVPEENEAFSAASSRIARGIMLTAYIPYGNEPTITEGSRGLPYYVSTARNLIGTKINRLLDGDLSGLLKGVLLGDKSEMSSELVSYFRICGLSHLLAVSGLHMSIIVYVLSGILRNLGIPYRPLAAILLVFVWGYIALTGFSYSVIRAGLMTSMMLIARVFNREADSLNSFGTSLLFICLFNPYAASDAGLLLSASSTLGLIALSSKVLRRVNSFIDSKTDDAFGIIHNIASTVVTSMVATACATPALMLYFGEYSIISPLANLLCIQLSTIFMLSGALAVVLSFIPFVGGVLSRLAAVITWLSGKIIEIIVKFLGSLPNASIFVNYDFLPVFFISSALMLAAWLILNRKRENRFRSLCICAAVIAQVFIVGIAAEHITRLNDRYVTIYSVDDGIAVTAVSGYDCAVIGTGGDRYAAWQMTVNMQDQNLSRVDALFFPGAGDEYASYADDFIAAISPEYIFMPQLSEASDEMAYAVRDRSEGLYDITDASYSSKNGKLKVETYTDADGLIWVNIINGRMQILICPENGNCSGLPEDMRYPWCAVLMSSDIINIGALSPTSIVVSADSDECADAEALLRYRGVEYVYTTAQGNIVLRENGAGMRIGGE